MNIVKLETPNTGMEDVKPEQQELSDDVVMYTEYCKQQQPSISAEEIQGKLLEHVCLIQNVPSKSSIQEDLDYSYKRLIVVPRESLSVECEQRLIDNLSL